MKEYICKAILLNVIERNTLWNTNEAFEGLIKNIPTITKIDICREFSEKIKQMMKMPEYGFCDIERIMEIALEEMKNERIYM